MSLHALQNFHRPTDSDEVVGLLERYGEVALIVGGGTFVHGLEARGLLFGIEALIDIQGLGFDSLTSGPEGLTIGATATYAQLEESANVQGTAALGAIKDTLKYPPVQIKNVGTVGGSVSASCPFFDVPVALMALDGVVHAQGANGSREIGLAQFFAGLFENSLAANEFTAKLVVPPPPPNTASAFIKFETNANDLAIVNVAVRITVDASGVCRDARVVVGGGVGETLVRSSSSEQLLNGEKLDAELFQAAGQAVRSDIEPISDHRASSQYRSTLAAVLTQRALSEAVNRLR